MTAAINRRQFLRGYYGSREPPVRPPWALSEVEFLRKCTSCCACIESCPEKIITAGPNKIPEISFSASGCTFCGACVEVCADGALTRTADQTCPWSITAHVNDKCISRRGITCRACADNCELEAIRFRPDTGGIAHPVLNKVICTGCGFCIAVCPVNAIETSHNDQETNNHVSN